MDNMLRSRLNLGFNLNYFSFLKFVHLELFIFTVHVLKFFIQEWIYTKLTPNIYNNIIGGISSFQNGLNDLFSSTGFYFKSKVIEGSHKGKNNMFFKFWAFFFQNAHFWSCDTFSRLVVIQSTQFFSGNKYL